MRRSLARRGEGRVGGSLRDPGGVGVEDGGEFVRGWRAGVFHGKAEKEYAPERLLSFILANRA